MSPQISRRSFLKELTGIVGSATIGTMIPKIAEACGEKVTPWTLIKRIAQNPGIEKTDKDGIVYIRTNVGLDILNDISMNPGKYPDIMYSTDGKESVYETLEEAIKNRETESRYVVGINVRDGFGYGNVSQVYDLSKRKFLKGFPRARCIGAPMEFEE
ncbi:twin-arginine translocation signal domain-containing protein [Candidatus Pacearchaeota archaeon]|nr:twin-arginine translocation signal domain-containing protein [Candidatus Pacearchaeota archaeon]